MMAFGDSGWAGTNAAFDPILLRGPWLKTSQAAPVLIIDDDAVVAEMYRLALVRNGFSVLVAKDGIAGLEIASASDPALIFLDIKMPHMDGMEVLERLAADPALVRVPVVMLSNYDDSSYVKRCIGLGAKEYIVKVNIRPADLATIALRWIKPLA